MIIRITFFYSKIEIMLVLKWSFQYVTIQFRKTITKGGGMKKTLAMVVMFVVGLAFSSYAQIDTKQSSKVQGATTTETTTVKSTQGTAKETVTTNVNKPGEVSSTTEVKGKGGEFKRTMTETPDKISGTTMANIKKGSIDDLKIDWTYQKVGTNYVLEYTVKENKNPNLVKELGLTKDQANAIAPGKHTITSTSEYTVADVQKNFRALILEDLKKSKSAIAK